MSNAIKDLDYKLRAVASIRQEYYRLIAQERGLIGADTVLDMIDAALTSEIEDVHTGQMVSNQTLC